METLVEELMRAQFGNGTGAMPQPNKILDI